MCSKPQVSSHYTPNRVFLDRFPNSERFDVEYRTTMEFVALDDLDISANDFIKISTAGIVSLRFIKIATCIAVGYVSLLDCDMLT